MTLPRLLALSLLLAGCATPTPMAYQWEYSDYSLMCDGEACTESWKEVPVLGEVRILPTPEGR